jgi:transcriptional regulator with XRE-family HTH domain
MRYIVNTSQCGFLYGDVYMMTIEAIRLALQDRRLTAIAQATGLHYNTVSAIKRGTQLNPSYDTLSRLSAYLNGPTTARLDDVEVGSGRSY